MCVQSSSTKSHPLGESYVEKPGTLTLEIGPSSLVMDSLSQKWGAYFSVERSVATLFDHAFQSLPWLALFAATSTIIFTILTFFKLLVTMPVANFIGVLCLAIWIFPVKINTVSTVKFTTKRI